VKAHDLRPAPGSRTPRTRVGRGIAAGKGKTAGRGTKGQRSRAGASIPPWFEGGQTPIHIRIPKLRGFKRYGRVDYQVVNVGRIGDYARAGRFGGDAGGREPITVNAEVLRAAGLVSSADKPLKVLGGGDLDVKLVVAAEAFTGSARSKIEAAGGYVQSLAPEPAPKRVPRERAAAPAEAAVATDDPAEVGEPSASDKPARRGKAAKAGVDETVSETEPLVATADGGRAATEEDADTAGSESGASEDEPAIAEAAALDEPAEEPETDETADADRATE
jgi:large subunit ribosomal protein L15